jgi:hypothetical protein
VVAVQVDLITSVGLAVQLVQLLAAQIRRARPRLQQLAVVRTYLMRAMAAPVVGIDLLILMYALRTLALEVMEAIGVQTVLQVETQ